jgi:hypothetical protein
MENQVAILIGLFGVTIFLGVITMLVAAFSPKKSEKVVLLIITLLSAAFTFYKGFLYFGVNFLYVALGFIVVFVGLMYYKSRK